MPLIKFNCIYLFVFPLLITYHNNNNNYNNNNNNASRFVYGNFSCAKKKSEKENNKIKRIMQETFLAAYIPTLWLVCLVCHESTSIYIIYTKACNLSCILCIYNIYSHYQFDPVAFSPSNQKLKQS